MRISAFLNILLDSFVRTAAPLWRLPKGFSLKRLPLKPFTCKRNKCQVYDSI